MGGGSGFAQSPWGLRSRLGPKCLDALLVAVERAQETLAVGVGQLGAELLEAQPRSVRIA